MAKEGIPKTALDSKIFTTKFGNGRLEIKFISI